MDFLKKLAGMEKPEDGADYGSLGLVGNGLGLLSDSDSDPSQGMGGAYRRGREQMNNIMNDVELDQSDRDSVARAMDYGGY